MAGGRMGFFERRRILKTKKEHQNKLDNFGSRLGFQAGLNEEQLKASIIKKYEGQERNSVLMKLELLIHKV